MRIKISADSTCDLSRELIEKNDINIVPLHVVKDEKEYSDGVDIMPKDIFDHVANGGDLVSTAAVSVGEYEEHFAKFANEYDAVIHINIGSGFSCTHQNACEAAKSFDNVYVVDSQNLSTGHGHVVLEAVRLAKEGKEPEKIVEELNDIAPRVETSFILDRLDYMRKGGRCSTITYLGANMLKIKPCIEVVGGRMKVGKKYRGSWANVLKEYVKDRLKDRDDIIEDKIFITYTTATPEALEGVYTNVKDLANFENIYETTAGCTVSAHCGPYCLGILFIRKK